MSSFATGGCPGVGAAPARPVAAVTGPGPSLAEANPGLPLGPVSFRGRYEAPFPRRAAAPELADVAERPVRRAGLGPPAGSIRLGQAEQKFALRIQGIQLGEIFRVYPAEGLAGEGALDGELPLMLNRWKPSVSGGQVKAASPATCASARRKSRRWGAVTRG